MDENKTCPYYLKDKKFDIFGNLLWYKKNKKKTCNTENQLPGW